MNQKDQKRLKELLEEIEKIFSSDDIHSYSLIIKDINKELKGIMDRSDI